MIYSMTGYGKSEVSLSNATYNIELRALNSKFLDFKLKVPSTIKEFELSIRKIITDKIQRGKVELFISESNTTSDEGAQINATVLKNYFKQLTDVNIELGVATPIDITSLLRLPNVMASEEEEQDEDFKKKILAGVQEAAKALMKFRLDEGHSLLDELTLRTNNISQLLVDLETPENERVAYIRERITQKLNDLQLSDKFDENRLEQELVYYIEKFDIAEEKTRLVQHCKYFLEVLNNKDIQKGKKLGFIAQEMGREINTTGSKANNTDLQKIVVQMKDELEKIKEQVANVI